MASQFLQSVYQDYDPYGMRMSLTKMKKSQDKRREKVRGKMTKCRRRRRMKRKRKTLRKRKPHQGTSCKTSAAS